MIVLYTNNCPKCKVLKSKLDSQNIKYDVCEDVNIMISKGFRSMPILQVEGDILLFADAVKWVNEVNKQ